MTIRPVGQRRRGGMAFWCLLGLAWVTVVALGGRAWAAENARVSASLLSMPPHGGWTEILLVVRAGDSPWQGTVAVADTTAKVQIRLSVAARGQRVVPLPFWVGPGGNTPHVWLDGVPAGRVETPPLGERTSRILYGDVGGLTVSRSSSAGTASGSRVSLTAWPETWRAYDAYDLVIVPAGLDRVLRPEQEEALANWIRWGGSVGLVEAARGPSASVRAVGAGAGIVAGTPDAVRGAVARWTDGRASAPKLSQAMLHAWERARPWTGKTTWRVERPGAALGIVLMVYLTILAAVAVAFALFPRFRPAGMRAVLTVLAMGLLATWSVAQVGASVGLVVREATLLRAQPDGGDTHASTWIQARADRRGESRFEPVLRRPLLAEVEPSGERSNPQRAIRWDIDGGVWVRPWAVGETAVVRVDGIGPDINVRVAATGSGRVWEIDNRGPHALRAIGVLRPDGRFRPVPDIPPGSRHRLEAAPGARDDTTGENPVPDFWRALLPARDVGARWQPVLVATLDPPVRSVRFLKDDAGAVAECYLVVPLPASPEF